MATTITRKLEWDSGHRVLGHGGKCRHLHGHRYVAEVTVEASNLDQLGMVVDFSTVKTLVGKWIDDNWDHNLLLHSDDPQWEHLVLTEERPPYCMGQENPTAENIARHLATVARELLGPSLTIKRVRIYETPNCWADWSLEER